MLRTLAPVAALLLSVALLLMGNGLQNTLVPVRANIEAFSPLALGLLGGCYYAGFGIGCLCGPRIVRRVGHIRAFTAIVAVASAATLVHAIFVDEIVWIALRALTGFCFAVIFMVIESWLHDKATNETRGTVFSVYIVINLTVVTIGQMMLTLDDVRGFTLFALASILVSLAAAPLAMTRSQQPALPSIVRLRLLRLYRLSPVGVVGAFCVGLINSTFWTLGPVFAVSQASGDGAAATATFMAVGAIAGAAGQWPLGRASDKTDRRRVIVFACIGGAIAGLSMFLLGEASDSARLACIWAFGLFAIPLYALTAAHMNDKVEKDGFVEAAGGMLLIFSMGAILGPVFASVAMRAYGGSAMFLYTAAVHLMLAGFTIYRIKRRAPAAESERGEFAEALLQTQTVAAIEPNPPSAEDRPTDVQ